jgi:hypothetical protein
MENQLVKFQQINEAAPKFLPVGIIKLMPIQSEDYLTGSLPFKTQTQTNFGLPISEPTYSLRTFQIKGVLVLRKLVEKEDFMCKIDLDAYTMAPIHPES